MNRNGESGVRTWSYVVLDILRLDEIENCLQVLGNPRQLLVNMQKGKCRVETSGQKSAQLGVKGHKRRDTSQ